MTLTVCQSLGYLGTLAAGNTCTQHPSSETASVGATLHAKLGRRRPETEGRPGHVLRFSISPRTQSESREVELPTSAASACVVGILLPATTMI